MIRALRLLLHLAPFGLTLACLAWLATQSPFATPLVARADDEVRAALTRAMAREVDANWIVPRMEAAIAAQDLSQIELLVDLAITHEVAVPPALKDRLQNVVEAQSGILATAQSCGACAYDIAQCPNLMLLGACGVTFELTPGGDLNALRRGAVAYASGEPVDRFDLGLALVGLGATGAVLVTGGTSYSVKAASGLLRVANRLGTLTPQLTSRITGLLGDAVRWDRFADFARFQARPADLVDAAKLGELAALGRSLERVRGNTSLADTIILMRQVDSAEDAARLARVSDVMGPGTRGSFEVLGKARVFRALVRLSDLTLSALAALVLGAAQILTFLAQQLGNRLLRGARRGMARRASGRAGPRT